LLGSLILVQEIPAVVVLSEVLVLVIGHAVPLLESYDLCVDDILIVLESDLGLVRPLENGLIALVDLD